MNTVTILLATYNSSKFLREQLDSLFQQTFREWTLVIRDDGSSDETIAIIKEFQQKFPNILLLEDTNKNIGASKSFMRLLEKTDSSYYFFCDHDDIWLPNKVKDSLDLMKKTELGNMMKPVIIHSDLKVVDKNLNIISNSFWKSSGIKPNYLENKNLIQVFNCVTGCTMLFNKTVKEIAFPYPASIPMHDWWLAIVTLRNNGIIRHIDQPTILYRQHGSNEVGARMINCSYFIKKLRTISNTLEGHKSIRNFLQDIKGINFLQFYAYKIFYTIIRKI
ncbi:glycosyltransferase family 2 protein [Kaistella montana]|uniref:Glycosyltransferase family 2 protein n=1 Tax=Kaistella montana TaxID=1849733 RepID=A0ABW5KBA4_9FLAO|nr:glycosyltransferase family 2 protein [Kaistella montana]MCQ4035373.1 glycosyltransferase family 2 protein [Kaistella montana]